MSLVPNSDIEPGSTVVVYAPDIESEVETIYRRLYDGTLSVEGLLTVLEAAKPSDNARDHEIFAGVLHTVFDEYKFYPEYPPRELKITAHLFGSIIQHRLVENVPLGIAIRYVLSSLNDPKLFNFGVQALARFHTRLVEFPGVCHELLNMQHFVEAQPDLAEQVRKALKYAESGAFGDGIQPVFSSIQADDFEDTDIADPPEEVSDKILFIVNNLAISNLDSKTNEMKEWYSDGVARWFARYLVEERVSTEPNNHSLYLQFLDSLAKPVLSKLILHETYAKSARLLNDENTLSSASDRLTLKHLGSWLGKLTLEKDRPLRFKNLSLKDLLLEGFDCQRLLVAIPFTCKILEAAKNSTVFRPPHNPWLMPILGLLVELYFQADLKLNQKFEIEVLFKDLDLLMDDVGPTSLLSTRPGGRPGTEMIEGDIDRTGPSIAAVNPMDGPSNGYIADPMNGDLSGAMINDPEIALYLESLLMEMRPRLFFEVELEPYVAIPRFLAMVRGVFENATRETCVRFRSIHSFQIGLTAITGGATRG
jgi:CCR4-NOT transcription complex subunit 1